MSRFCTVDQEPEQRRLARLAMRVAIGFSLCVVLLSAGEGEAASELRVAVAPFAGEGDSLAIAKGLASELAERDLERLLAPGDFVAARAFEPRAADVRRWAYNSAVDTIVVGRVYSVGSEGRRTRVVEAALRSGHSGAELSRHEVSVASGADIQQSVESLALSILAGLGYQGRLTSSELVGGTGVASGGSAPEIGGGDSQAPGSDGSEQGLDLGFSQSGFRSDAPIEIKAEEAEIINRNGGRRLIFQRNVVVTQANVSLRSDRLEALYRKGESEPRELRAEGRVEIDQGDRRAKCDRAIYQREAHRLTCIGNAELVQGCDIVRGESIEFDLAGDQARVEGAASIVIQPEGDVPTSCSSERGAL